MPHTQATNSIQDWNAQDQYVERNMNNASFTAAHPDHTLVLAGPPRLHALGDSTDSLQPLGMLQNFQSNARKQTTPVQTIGSSRTFFVSSKPQIGFSIGRLMVNGRNLLRALYTIAVQQSNEDGFIDRLQAPPANNSRDQFYIDLDSELFFVPFGLMILNRSVAQDTIGGKYIELCMLQSYQTGIRSGQNMIMENVRGVADRMKPLPRTILNILGEGANGATRVGDLNTTGTSSRSSTMQTRFLDVEEEGSGVVAEDYLTDIASR